MELHLHPSSKKDISKILEMETETEARQFIIPYTESQHLKVIKNEDEAHLSILSQHNKCEGFVILAGIKDPNNVVEFRRIVIDEKGKGYGRKSIRLVKKYCFEVLECNRLWLDVFDFNKRARGLYKSENFFEEGVLRECVKIEGGYANLVIMSLLKSEYQKV